MERLACGQDDVGQYDIEQAKLFWNSKNYEEYACTCDIRSLPRLWTKEEFDSLRSFEWMVEAKHCSAR